MQHLAIIMDGNRRWAYKRGLRPWFGHESGAEAIKCATTFCLKEKIRYLSLYTFSLENFKRSPQELNYLFDILSKQLMAQLDQFIQNDIRIRFIGDRSRFPDKLLPFIEIAEDKTAHCTTLHLNFLFCYGARQEIISGVKELLRRIKNGLLSETDINDEMLQQCFWTAGIPEPDLIIRTGGAKRISNFLLYQAAYSELYFLDCFWPDITESHLKEACYNFNQCQRNYGA